MARQVPKVAILSDSPLQQHLLQGVMEQGGFEVVLNKHPERISPDAIGNEMINCWLIDVVMEDEHQEFLNALLERDGEGMIFTHGEVPERQSHHFDKWVQRLIKKVEQATTFKPAAFDIHAVKQELDNLLLERRVQQGVAWPNLPLPKQLPIWVLGSSLGGPQAVKQFLDTLPDNIPAAFLYAQHIDAGCLDALSISLGRHSALKMEILRNGSVLQAGHVYVVPTEHEYVVSSRDRAEQLLKPWPGPYGPSIDQMIINLASSHGKRAGAIIFSGMGSDGALGCEHLIRLGGRVLVQAPESCIQASMPNSVLQINRCQAANPAEMASAFVEQLKQQLEQNTEQGERLKYVE